MIWADKDLPKVEAPVYILSYILMCHNIYKRINDKLFSVWVFLQVHDKKLMLFCFRQFALLKLQEKLHCVRVWL